jgi:flagellin
MAQEITLSTATRTNLLSLQNTTGLIGRTQERLATGLKINSALDDALAYFKARNLNSRAADLQNIKDSITGGVSVITAAVQGLDSMESVLKQMKAIAQSAISAPESSTRAKLASQFNELRSQVDGLAADASFNGINLLKNSPARFHPGADQLTVKFNERTEPQAINQLVISGLKASEFRSIMATSAVTAGTAGNTLVWGQTGTAAIKGMSLQTRQQLGTISLSIAQKSEEAILRLF